MKRVKSFLVLLCVLLSVPVFCCACDNDTYEGKSSEYILYQVLEDGTGLGKTHYNSNVSPDDTVGVIEDLLRNFKEVDVRDFQIKEKQLSLFLSSSYNNIHGIDEVLLRAAIVKTLCQVEGVEYVEFFVGDELLTIDGEQVGVMSQLSFLDSIGGDGSTQTKYVTLFYSDMSGSGMKEITARITYDMTVPLARLLVEQLIAGPDEAADVNTSDVRETIPNGTALNSVTIRDNVCYVDFSKEFVNLQAEVKSEIVIYSIVNTLCELSNVSKVQFTIDGEQREMYGDMRNFDTPFERNLDLVSGGSKG